MEDNLLFHESTKQSVWQTLKAVLATNQPHQLIIKPYRKTRSLSQNSLFHLWCAEISKYLCANNANFTAEQVKEMLKHTFLGYEVVERIDVTTQQPERVRTLKRTSKLDTGEIACLYAKSGMLGDWHRLFCDDTGKLGIYEIKTGTG
ncbi:recombination protein NinB [Arsenophonus endosymbiont of Crataerina pallida]|uniref:recombination protein NinB n=1 Tax=Arsenophonus endosymbiont of Crataerina pallida TaxID=3066235 RepID=UPI0030CE1677